MLWIFEPLQCVIVFEDWFFTDRDKEEELAAVNPANVKKNEYILFHIIH